MKETIRKAVTELLESKDKKVTFDLDEEVIDLKIDIVSFGTMLPLYKIKILIGEVQYSQLITEDCNNNVNYISNIVVIAFCSFIINKKQIQESTWKSVKLTYCIDNEEEDKNNENNNK